MTFHNKNEIEIQRSKVNFDVHVVDTFAHGLCARANTGGSNSAVLGCSLAQSQADERCRDGVACVVFLQPVLPVHCYPFT